MKKILIIFGILLFIVTSTFTQVPQSYKYQAVARDGSGNIIANVTVSLRITIVTGSPNGSVLYRETHNPVTNQFGLFSVEIGKGNIIFGDFSTISWGTNIYFMKTELDDSGGSSYTHMGTSQLLSVPYALYSENTENVDDADADPTNEFQTISKAGSTVTLSDGGGNFNDDVDDADNNPANEFQAISRLGTDVTLSDGGGTVSVEDNDNDPANEFQIISKAGSTVTLSDGGGSFTDEVDDADNNPTNEFQTISRLGTDVTLSDGGGTVSVADNDNDATNELQALSLIGNNLSIKPAGNTVIIPTGGAAAINDLTDGKTDNTSVFLGSGAGINDDGTGNSNVAVGIEALFANTSGWLNTAIGYQALNKNTIGESNTAVGKQSLLENTLGKHNTAFGCNAASSNTSGMNNTAIGYSANRYNQIGTNNTIIGYEAGSGNLPHNKSGNIFLGFQAGYSEHGSNKLYIENSNTTSPLIYGEFDNDIVNINGNLGINNDNPAYNLDINSTGFDISTMRIKSDNDNYFVFDKGALSKNSYLLWKTAGSSKWILGSYFSNDDFVIKNWDLGGMSDNTLFIDNATSAIALNSSTARASDVLGIYPGNDYEYGLYMEFDRTTSGHVYGIRVYVNNAYYGTTSTSGIYSFVKKYGGGNGSCDGIYSYVLDSQTGYGNRFSKGVYGSAGVSSANGTSNAIGVYGMVIGNADESYGVYYSGGLGGTGTKSAIVRTDDGPKEVYCLETPGNWFEDVGEGKIKNGKAIVNVPADFLQTVTINTQYPMRVFITPNANLGNWWVEKDEAFFILHAPDAADGSTFDFRIMAKRKGYEDLRLREAPAAYTDHFLYPEIKDVPPGFRFEWVRLIAPEQRDPSWMSYLTPEEQKQLREEEKHDK